MQMKCEEDKEPTQKSNRDKHRFGPGENGGAASEFTSTFQSIDLPPKEYCLEIGINLD